MITEPAPPNIDVLTVQGFGEEWDAYDQTALPAAERQAMFDQYFSIFPFETLPPNAEGFDMGCGSGRWAELIAPLVGRLHCIDPAEKALAVARRRLAALPSAILHHAHSDNLPIGDRSQDFGYSLGVLHHIPNTALALEKCVQKLKPGAPFLIYLYYSFENRPVWFRAIWRLSDLGRRMIYRLPFKLRKLCTTVIGALVYWPLARFARARERHGHDVTNYPLSYYRNSSFYFMRADALDRFGTRLEQRFSRREIEAMMLRAGLQDVRFSDQEPFWVACGRRRPDAN